MQHKVDTKIETRDGAEEGILQMVIGDTVMSG